MPLIEIGPLQPGQKPMVRFARAAGQPPRSVSVGPDRKRYLVRFSESADLYRGVYCDEMIARRLIIEIPGFQSAAGLKQATALGQPCKKAPN